MTRNSYALPPGGGRGEFQPADAELVARLLALMKRHGGWGFWKYDYYLRKLRVVVNHKRLWRIYLLINLQLDNRRKRNACPNG